LSPAALILAFISCWSIAVVGGYLAVAGLGNVRRHSLASQPRAARRARPLVHRHLFLFWDVFLLLLGSLLMVMGMVFLYMLVYG